MQFSLRTLRLTLLLPLALMGTTACQTFRGVEMSTANALFSAEQEKALGQQYAQQIEQEIVVLDDPEIQAWVQDMGEKLVEHSPETEQSFTFKVTTSEQVNAFAIPGGFCYVNLGLIRMAENEAEIAAVVGHEVNHVTRRHGMRSLQRAMGIELLGTALSSDPRSATAVQLVSQAGGMVAMRSFGREDEREADYYGVEAMYKAGWDPRGAITFFEKLKGAENSGEPGLFAQIVSTHPTTTERIENIKQQVASYDLSTDLILSTPRFKAIQERVAAIPRQTEGQQMPN